jgi:hypothetical protein
MSANHEELNLTPKEKRFMECMTTADDFTKIEIYRSAAAWYKRALELKPVDEEARRKLEDIKNKIKKENKAIYAIVAALALVAIMTYLFN